MVDVVRGQHAVFPVTGMSWGDLTQTSEARFTEKTLQMVPGLKNLT